MDQGYASPRAGRSSGVRADTSFMLADRARHDGFAPALLVQPLAVPVRMGSMDQLPHPGRPARHREHWRGTDRLNPSERVLRRARPAAACSSPVASSS